MSGVSDEAISEYCWDRVQGKGGKVPLSHRIRAQCEAAPWVIEEVRALEADLAEAREKLASLAGATP